MKKFWLIWGEFPGMSPTVKHPSLAVARKEAERLTQQNPSRKVHVLELVGTCAVPATIWTEPEEEMPF